MELTPGCVDIDYLVVVPGRRWRVIVWRLVAARGHLIIVLSGRQLGAEHGEIHDVLGLVRAAPILKPRLFL